MTSIKEVDPKVHTVGIEGGYELDVTPAASICAVAGASHSSLSEGEFKESTLAIPVGVAIGKSFPAGDNAELVPFAVPHLLYNRFSFKAGDIDVSDSSTDFGLDLGATYRLDKLLLRAQVHVNSIDGSSATFGLGIGYAL